MESILRHLCKIHDLTAMSFMVQMQHEGWVSVYLHWDHDGESNCASRGGETFDAALAAALKEVETRRKFQAALANEKEAEDA